MANEDALAQNIEATNRLIETQAQHQLALGQLILATIRLTSCLQKSPALESEKAMLGQVLAALTRKS